jgi:hypothetical protein
MYLPSIVYPNKVVIRGRRSKGTGKGVGWEGGRQDGKGNGNVGTRFGVLRDGGWVF